MLRKLIMSSTSVFCISSATFFYMYGHFQTEQHRGRGLLFLICISFFRYFNTKFPVFPVCSVFREFCSKFSVFPVFLCSVQFLYFSDFLCVLFKFQCFPVFFVFCSISVFSDFLWVCSNFSVFLFYLCSVQFLFFRFSLHSV